MLKATKTINSIFPGIVELFFWWLNTIFSRLFPMGDANTLSSLHSSTWEEGRKKKGKKHMYLKQTLKIWTIKF